MEGCGKKRWMTENILLNWRREIKTRSFYIVNGIERETGLNWQREKK
jgi:hypothetical protein